MISFSLPQLEILKRNGILPVVCPGNQTALDTFLAAVRASSLNCVEITLRSAYATECIAYIKKQCPTLLVGAGTVLNEALLDAAVAAGADFCVSPGCDDDLMRKARERNIFFLPACATPTEMIHAANQGCKIIKFFPAECLGGVSALKLYAGALADISFVPTGGITGENLPDYLACSNVIACGGSFMAPKDVLDRGDTDEVISRITRFCKLRENR